MSNLVPEHSKVTWSLGNYFGNRIFPTGNLINHDTFNQYRHSYTFSDDDLSSSLTSYSPHLHINQCGRSISGNHVINADLDPIFIGLNMSSFLNSKI